MEKFIKTTKIKLLFMVLATLLPIIFIFYFDLISNSIFSVSQSVTIIRYVMFIFFEGVILYRIVTYIKILSDKDYANKTLVKRTDERVIYLKSKTFMFEYKLILYIHGLALVIAGFLNETVFYTLLGLLLFMLLSVQIVRIYYNKKY